MGSLVAYDLWSPEGNFNENLASILMKQIFSAPLRPRFGAVQRAFPKPFKALSSPGSPTSTQQALEMQLATVFLEGVAHRDLKLENFLLTEGVLSLKGFQAMFNTCPCQ